MSSINVLIYLCQKFPFEFGEEFIELEIREIQSKFDEVIVIPTGAGDYSVKRSISGNIKVCPISNPKNIGGILQNFVQNFFFFFPLLFKEIGDCGLNIRLLKYWVYHIPYALKIKKHIAHHLQKEKNYVVYSYWMDTNAYAISLLKKTIPELRFLVRSHGGDLYSDRRKDGLVPFRKSVYRQAESLILVSLHGLNYIRKEFPDFEEKVVLSRLGVADHGFGNKFFHGREYVVVSCSSLIPLKRVYLIGEILQAISLPIRWIHFGGEPDEIETLKKGLGNFRDGLEVAWKGRVSNCDVIEFYKNEFVDLFINLSISEGIPVSMMEATSFGIPVFGSCVGGVPEIVNARTGWLVDLDSPFEKIASELQSILQSECTRDFAYRAGVRSFWSSHYRAKYNYSSLFNILNSHSFNRSTKL